MLRSFLSTDTHRFSPKRNRRLHRFLRSSLLRCPSVSSVDSFLRNLRNLWFSFPRRSGRLRFTGHPGTGHLGIASIGVHRCHRIKPGDRPVAPTICAICEICGFSPVAPDIMASGHHRYRCHRWTMLSAPECDCIRPRASSRWPRPGAAPARMGFRLRPGLR